MKALISNGPALSESLPPPPGEPLIGFVSRSEKSHHFVDGSESAEAYLLVTGVSSFLHPDRVGGTID